MKEKNLKQIIVLLVVLVIVLAIGIVYLINVQKGENNITINEKTRNANKEISQENTSTIIKNADSDDAYSNYSSKMQQTITNNFNSQRVIDGEKIDAVLLGEESGATEDNGISGIHIDKNKVDYLTFKEGSAISKKLATCKLATDVIKCGVSQTGQDMSFAIWVINSKGEVYYQMMDAIQENTKSNQISNIALKKAENLSKIIDVVRLNNGESNVLAAIDINGKLTYIEE